MLDDYLEIFNNVTQFNCECITCLFEQMIGPKNKTKKKNLCVPAIKTKSWSDSVECEQPTGIPFREPCNTLQVSCWICTGGDSTQN